MDQSSSELKTSNEIHHAENKRVLEDDEGASSNYKEGFKKARYSWQIKGKTEVGGTSTGSKSSGSKSLEKANDICYEVGHKNTCASESSNIAEGNMVVNESVLKYMTEKDSTSDSTTHANEAKVNVNYKSDALIKPSASANATQTKFEMLREMGNEYSERIQEFIKSQAQMFDCDENQTTETDSDVSSSSDDSQERFQRHQASATNQSASQSSQGQKESDRNNLNFDSPQLNHHLFNISSWLWQKQEVGCAIVDNVFNRTLEELGLSPDPEANLQAKTRLTVEHQSIEAAINEQGLSVGDEIDIVTDEEDTRSTLESESNNLDSVNCNSCIDSFNKMGTTHDTEAVPNNSSVEKNVKACSSKTEKFDGKSVPLKKIDGECSKEVHHERVSIGANSFSESQDMKIADNSILKSRNKKDDQSLAFNPMKETGHPIARPLQHHRDLNIANVDSCSRRSEFVKCVEHPDNEDVFEKSKGDARQDNLMDVNENTTVRNITEITEETAISIKASKEPENILDLAVSTAILSQGLSLQ